MEFIDPALHLYSEQHTSEEPPLLQRVNRDTHAGVLKPRMLSGHLQGRLLSMLSKMLRPQSVLEIGTYTGYSALCLAEGLAPGGKLITIDVNEELETRVKQYINESVFKDSIGFMIGNAAEILPVLSGPFDLVWIDADKANYAKYFDLVIDKVRPGGIILADNVLWSGKVLLENDKDPKTKAIKAFNDKIQADSRVENVLLPVRDGILMMRKI